MDGNRLKELKRRTMDEQEELLRQEQARAMRKKEEQIQAERELRDKQAKIEAKEREEERLRKQEEHRLQTQRILDEQQVIFYPPSPSLPPHLHTPTWQSEIKARLEEMEKQEAIRLEMMERKNEQRRRAMAAKRRAIEERIERNMKMAVKIEQKRKDDFIAKVPPPLSLTHSMTPTFTHSLTWSLLSPSSEHPLRPNTTKSFERSSWRLRTVTGRCRGSKTNSWSSDGSWS